jgi:histidine triad (HIT) family protein
MQGGCLLVEDCIFCKIISGDIPSSIIYEDEHVLAFHDINPIAPIHILLIPRLHISSFNDILPENKELMGHMAWVSKEIAKQNNIDETGYRIVINCGEQGGQEVYHLHAHILGGRFLGGIAGR